MTVGVVEIHKSHLPVIHKTVDISYLALHGIVIVGIPLLVKTFYGRKRHVESLVVVGTVAIYLRKVVVIEKHVMLALQRLIDIQRLAEIIFRLLIVEHPVVTHSYIVIERACDLSASYLIGHLQSAHIKVHAEIAQPYLVARGSQKHKTVDAESLKRNILHAVILQLGQKLTHHIKRHSLPTLIKKALAKIIDTVIDHRIRNIPGGQISKSDCRGSVVHLRLGHRRSLLKDHKRRIAPLGGAGV